MRETALAIVVLLVAAILAGYFMLTPAPATTTEHSAPRALSTGEASALFAAVDEDNTKRVSDLLGRWAEGISARGEEHGETLLHHARSVEMARLLIAAGADVTVRDRSYKATAARWARSEWRNDVADLLEQLEPVDQDLVYFVASGRDSDVRRMLLQSPETLDERTGPTEVLGQERHLLHIAATYGRAEVTKALLEAGADVNVDGGWANSQPLENAAWGGYTDTVKVLLAAGADMEAREGQANHTALWYAAVTGREEVVRVLLDAGAKVEEGMADAVRAAVKEPYPGRDLPEQAAYLRVAAMLDGQ